MSTIVTSDAPWGMRWTARVPGPTLGEGLEAADVHARRLFVGMLALAEVSLVVSALATATLGDLVATAGAFGAVLVLGAILWHFATTGRRYRAYVRGFLAVLYVVGWGGALMLSPERIAASGQAAWGLFTHIPLAVLLLGPREGVRWAALHLVSFGLVMSWDVLGLPRPFGVLPATGLVEFVFTSLMASLLLLASLVWFSEQRLLVEADLKRERERSDALLRAVLPDRVAERLRAGERVAQHHPEGTVLFADLVGFTAWSSGIDAREVVDTLDRLFADLDDLAQAHGIEKIKTIGDCYMVVSGLPEARPDHVQALARFALALSERLEGHRLGDRPLQMRIGLHTGPLVAGVIGRRRFQYDTWGDTVNTAARMESTGEPGRIQVTGAVRQALGEAFVLEERGAVEVKGKGPMRTWWLVGEATAGEAGETAAATGSAEAGETPAATGAAATGSAIPG